MSERKPGKSDMYSIGLLILYVMCESDELFYSIRNNIVKDGESWIWKFRNIPLIELVIQMINFELTVEECRQRWEEVSDKVEKISKIRLELEYNFDVTCLESREESNSDVFDKSV